MGIIRIQTNVPASVALNFFEFRGKGQTDATVSTLGHYIGAGLPDISRPSTGPEPLDHPCRTRTERADTAR